MKYLIYNLSFLSALLFSNFSYGQPGGSVLEIDQYSRAYSSSTSSVFGGDFSVETWVSKKLRLVVTYLLPVYKKGLTNT